MIRIATDTGCEIRQDPEKGVYVIPLQLNFEDEPFDCTMPDAAEKFYENIRQGKQPKTSQPSPGLLEQMFEQAKEANDQLVYICISSGLSGTYSLASMIAGDYENVRIIDSQFVTLAQKALVERAVQLRDQGLSLQDLCEQLEQDRARLRLFANIDTLEYLKKGGRVSAAAATVGEMLSIKPILCVEEGKVVLKAKARGFKKAVSMVKGFLEKELPDPGKPFVFGYSGKEGIENEKRLREQCALMFGREDCEIEPVPTTLILGAHTGPGASAVAYFVKETSES